MRIFFRRNTVTFEQEFLDVDGETANVATAILKLLYPAEGWPLNGDDLTEATVTLTENLTTNLWTGTWQSDVSQPGIVYWHAYTSDSGTASVDGHFRLRGNQANLSVEAA